MCVGRRRKQEVGAPFQAELDAEDAKDKESLSQHLQLVDKVHDIVVDKVLFAGKVYCRRQCAFTNEVYCRR